MSVDKSGRALLVVNSLAAVGEPKFRWLYQFCEASGVAVAEALLRPHYAECRIPLQLSAIARPQSPPGDLPRGGAPGALGLTASSAAP